MPTSGARVASLSSPLAVPAQLSTPASSSPQIAPARNAIQTSASVGSEYQPYPTHVPRGTSEDFLTAEHEAAVRAEILSVVAQEGPISLRLLGKRLGALWGFGRLGARLRLHLEKCAQSAGVRLDDDGDGQSFFWPAEQSPASYRAFRVPSADPGSSRTVEDISLSELANAALATLGQGGPMPARDLTRETARVLGFSRIGRNVQARVDSAVQRLVQLGLASNDGSMITPSPGTAQSCAEEFQSV